jgi:hypothetical protein
MHQLTVLQDTHLPPPNPRPRAHDRLAPLCLVALRALLLAASPAWSQDAYPWETPLEAWLGGAYVAGAG